MQQSRAQIAHIQAPTSVDLKPTRGGLTTPTDPQEIKNPFRARKHVLPSQLEHKRATVYSYKFLFFYVNNTKINNSGPAEDT